MGVYCTTDNRKGKKGIENTAHQELNAHFKRRQFVNQSQSFGVHRLDTQPFCSVVCVVGMSSQPNKKKLWLYRV